MQESIKVRGRGIHCTLRSNMNIYTLHTVWGLGGGGGGGGGGGWRGWWGMEAVVVVTIHFTHWGRKMATIFQTTFWNGFSWMKMYEFKSVIEVFPGGPIYNIPAWVEIMAWRRPGDNPLSEPMVSLYNIHILYQCHITMVMWHWLYAYMRHSASLC